LYNPIAPKNMSMSRMFRLRFGSKQRVLEPPPRLDVLCTGKVDDFCITWHVRKKQLFVGPTPLNIYVFVKLDTFPQGLSEHKTNMKPPSTNV